MSYILDALKRADTERERGAVPGLYARQVINPSRTAGRNAGERLWIGLAVSLLVLGLVAAGLYFLRPTAEPTLPRPAPPATAQAAPSPASPTAAPPSAAPTPAAVAAAAQPRPQMAQPLALARPAPTPLVASVAPSVASAQTAPAPATPTATPSPAGAISAVVAPPLPSTPLLADLPEELRRQIPSLTITGVVFSDAPGQRLLLVNNQVMTQGSPVAPELMLIEVGAKSSVFSFRGNRFRLPH